MTRISLPFCNVVKNFKRSGMSNPIVSYGTMTLALSATMSNSSLCNSTVAAGINLCFVYISAINYFFFCFCFFSFFFFSFFFLSFFFFFFFLSEESLLLALEDEEELLELDELLLLLDDEPRFFFFFFLSFFFFFFFLSLSCDEVSRLAFFSWRYLSAGRNIVCCFLIC